MRKLILLFILIPTLVFSQKKDYKTYDKAVKYNVKLKTEMQFESGSYMERTKIALTIATTPPSLSGIALKIP